MRMRILGCATSIGVPVIGCDCEVCTSQDPRNFRTRTSAVVEQDDRTLLIDTSTDFRFQALWQNVQRVDAVILTHAHADHVSGMDDLRVYNFRQGGTIPVYGNSQTIKEVARRFGYIFEDTQRGGGKPQVELIPVESPFQAAGFDIIPIPLLHGRLEIFGYRFGDIAYCTDVSEIPESSYKLLEGVRVLVLDALREKMHPTHFNLQQALEAIERIKPKHAFLTHLTHAFDYVTLSQKLPANVSPAFDGLVIE